MLIARFVLAVSLVALVMSITTAGDAVRESNTEPVGRMTLMSGTAVVFHAGSRSGTPLVGVQLARPGDMVETGTTGVLVFDFGSGETSVPPQTSVLIISTGSTAVAGFRLGGALGRLGRVVDFLGRLSGATEASGSVADAAQVRGSDLVLLTVPGKTGGPGLSGKICGCRRT